MQSGILKFLFVINPVSGGRKKENFESAIHSYFKLTPHKVEFFLLDGKNDAASLTHWISTWKPDRVIAVGGDGTVSMVAKKLMGTNLVMGILPAGSANGLAKELDIKFTIEDALDTILKGEVKKADVIRINDNHFCIHLSDIGLNARIIKHFEEKNIRGFIGYAGALLKALWRKTKMKVLIETGGELIKREALMVVLANATRYGTGAVINPNGNLYDGVFEVVVVKQLAFSELFRMMFRSKRFNPKNVEVFHTHHVIIQTKHKAHFQVDGEYLGKIDRLEAAIEPGMLNLVLPKGS